MLKKRLLSDLMVDLSLTEVLCELAFSKNSVYVSEPCDQTRDVIQVSKVEERTLG